MEEPKNGNLVHRFLLNLDKEETMPKKVRANKMELQKIPWNGSLIWIAVSPDDDVLGVCRTYQSLIKLSPEDMSKLFIVDTRKDTLKLFRNPSQEVFDTLCEEWRNHYFDEEWSANQIIDFDRRDNSV